MGEFPGVENSLDERTVPQPTHPQPNSYERIFLYVHMTTPPTITLASDKCKSPGREIIGSDPRSAIRWESYMNAMGTTFPTTFPSNHLKRRSRASWENDMNMMGKQEESCSRYLPII